MSAPAALRAEVARFFDTYRAAFERYDAAAISDLYAYPAHLTNDTGQVALVSVATREAWMRQVEDLLGTYRRLDVRSAKVIDLDLAELSPRLARATLRWALHDAGGKLVYDFDVTYVLGRFDAGLRVTSVVVHNEFPRARAALAARGATAEGKPRL